MLHECDHPTEWVRAKSIQMAGSVAKGKVCPKFLPGVCEYPLDKYKLEVVDSTSLADLVMMLSARLRNSLTRSISTSMVSYNKSSRHVLVARLSVSLW